MRVHDAFGKPGRAAAVDNVESIVVVDLDLRRLVAAGCFGYGSIALKAFGCID